MKSTLKLGLLLGAICSFCEGSTFKEPPRCGDWIPYKDEKCIKVASTAGHQTQEDAEIICESFKEELNRESYPSLITIKTEEEQKFLHKLLFVDNNVLDHVWLGLKQTRNGTDFEWNDGSKLRYSNWAKQNVSDDRHQCVQMESGEGMNEAGVWVRVNCGKTNTIICERTQTWTLENLQNMFLKYKFEQKLEMDALKDGKNVADKKIAAAEKEISHLKQNPVPIGFMYIQLASQEAPTFLWPQTKWTDVSSSYAGLFFRVFGGNAAAFGTVQEESTSRLDQVEQSWKPKAESHCSDGSSDLLSEDGNWSKLLYSGSSSGVNDICFRFRLKVGEVRPKNQAVKVWQRKS